MADLETLTLAFIESHPADAARVLEPPPAAGSAALCERVPARLGAPVLAAMLPPTAARNVTALGDERGMGLLSLLGAQRSEEHTSELQSRLHLVCRLLLE